MEPPDLIITSGVSYLHRVEVQPYLTDITPTFLQAPGTGPGRGVGGGVARVPDVGQVPGDGGATGGGAENTAGPETRSTGARGQTSQARTLRLKYFYQQSDKLCLGLISISS